MSEITTHLKDQRCQANLMALHRQLQDMAVRGMHATHRPTNPSRPPQGPTMVIRGK